MTWIWHFAKKYTWCCNIHVISMGYDIKWGVCERLWVSRWSTGLYGPSQSGRLQAGRPPLPLRLLHRHGTGPPQDRAIGPAGHYTVRGPGPGRHHDQTHRSPGARGPSQSGWLQVGRTPLLFKLHSTGLRPQDRTIGPAVQYTVCHCLWSLRLSGESVQSRIGFIGSLARAGQASQYTICQCTCTIWYT